MLASGRVGGELLIDAIIPNYLVIPHPPVTPPALDLGNNLNLDIFATDVSIPVFP